MPYLHTRFAQHCNYNPKSKTPPTIDDAACNDKYKKQQLHSGDASKLKQTQHCSASHEDSTSHVQSRMNLFSGTQRMHRHTSIDHLTKNDSMSARSSRRDGDDPDTQTQTSIQLPRQRQSRKRVMQRQVK